MENYADFKIAVPKLNPGLSDGILVILDCYAKVQFKSSQSSNTGEATKNEANLRPDHLAFLDYDAIYFELQCYRTEKARHNVNITKNQYMTCSITIRGTSYLLLKKGCHSKF